MMAPARRRCAQAKTADAELVQRVKLIVWLITATLVAGTLSLASIARAAPAPDSFADLAERLLPAVVNVSTTQRMTTAQRGGSLRDDLAGLRY